MPAFSLQPSPEFQAGYQRKPPEVRAELDNVLRFLNESGPTHNSLNSHRVRDRRAQTEEGVQVWESYVTWSHRVTWHYEPGYVIYLRSTNGHEILPRK